MASSDKQIKVIQLSHASHSFFAKPGDNVKDLILSDFYFRVAKQLQKYSNIEVECWGPEREWKEKTVIWKDVKFRFFPTTFSPRYALDFSIPMLKELKKEIRKCKQQNKKLIIHLHEYHNLHGLAIATFFKNQKIIAQHHGGSWPLKHMKQTKAYKYFFPLFWLGQLWENKVLKNIKVFFALSKEEMDYLKNKTQGRSKIKFQTMGIDEEYFEIINKKQARKRLGFKGNKKVLIFLGRINEEKGVRYLLDAMKRIEGKRKDVELKIIGFGKIKEFQEYANKLKLKNVEFTGAIFGDKKLLYLAAADALILPSSKEGAPVVVMEALAKNLPVVVTDVGGVRQMIENNQEGVIIKQKSSQDIVKAVEDILHWKKDIRKYAEKYKWEKIIKDTIGEYEGI